MGYEIEKIDKQRLSLQKGHRRKKGTNGVNKKG